MKTIIVPLDGSLLAEQALPHARMLAPLLSADLLLLRVIPPITPELHLAEELVANERYDMGYGRQYQGKTLLTQKQEAEHYLADHAAVLQLAGFEVEISAQAGQPAEIITEVAEGMDALIMMATHGRSGIRRWTLGSVTDKVIHATHAPVYVVRATERATPPVAPRTVLVPLDGSELARRALPFAADLASRANAGLILLTVAVPSATEYTGQMMMPPEIEPLLHQQMLQELGALVKKLEAQHVSVQTVVADGFPADTIIHEAARLHADLIVMSTHGRGGIGRWVLGSVADKVLHGAAQPLVLVRSGNQN